MDKSSEPFCSNTPDPASKVRCEQCGFDAESMMYLQDMHGSDLADSLVNTLGAEKLAAHQHAVKLLLGDLPEQTPGCPRIFIESLLEGLSVGLGLNAVVAYSGLPQSLRHQSHDSEIGLRIDRAILVMQTAQTPAQLMSAARHLQRLRRRQNLLQFQLASKPCGPEGR